ncbi:DUF4037 domain-containing protein [Sutcliffiella horikoshii]|uniref:DUF4037 domain-containing protein n=1 Tax=Sutcliffiella horikoshii TaxID=79883 RepID=A0A5D4SXV2_9BACI|nr:DUF4037 domain-containing protein [Sutcliffiella horikoshii]TYS68297.1 DUF4037 domain-containing protein [Sutcliffiella horikoshii]
MNLKQKAIEVAAIYKTNPKVDAILLAGSVALGWEDEFSDIELHILWKEAPTDADRKGPIRCVNGSILTYYPYEEEEWSESYVTSEGIKLEISNFLTSTIQSVVEDVVVKSKVNFDKQCLVASIQDGTGLHGKNLINTFKKRVVKYPSELAIKMVLENLEFGGRWNNRRALLEREDWLMLYNVFCNVQKKLMGVLFGLNSLYVHHPEYKWLPHKIEQMHIKPDQFLSRMNDILLGNPMESLASLEQLVEEVINIVEIHKPKLNIEKQKLGISYLK